MLKTTDQISGPQLVSIDVPRGIRMLKVLPHEHPHADVYNDAITMAANYVEGTWCQPGRGANAPDDPEGVRAALIDRAVAARSQKA